MEQDTNDRVNDCDRCGRGGETYHQCPYKSEINLNYELCNCCNSCKHECGQEI